MAEDMTELRCEAAPPAIRLGRYSLEIQPGLRFGFSDGMRGVGRYRTPWGAWLAWRRWMRAPSRPCE